MSMNKIKTKETILEDTLQDLRRDDPLGRHDPGAGLRRSQRTGRRIR